MDKKLAINISPHIFTPVDTRDIMKGVIKALIPAIIAGLYFFRWQALLVMLTSCLGCIVAERLCAKLRKKEIKWDYSSLLTGLLLALVLPPSIPLWMSFLGGFFAIAMGKELFGGVGHNIFNPALLSRAFLMAAFPVALTTWAQPFSLDVVTTATPLGLAKFEHVITSYSSLLLGNVAGSIGETSALALILGGIYLLYKKFIDYRIPVAYIATVMAIAAITHLINPTQYSPPLFHLLAGGLLIGAIFMATDPVTSPVTPKGRWIFGIGCGVVAMTIRLWGGLPEGVMYSVLFMNAVTPLINRIARPKRYGGKNAV